MDVNGLKAREDQIQYQKPAPGLSTRTVTTTADNFSQTTDSFLDGRTSKTYGDLSPDMEYTYAANPTGQTTTRSYTLGNVTRETTTTQSDWAGRTLTITHSDGATSIMAYNNKGQMVKSIDPDGVTTLYLYNALGEQVLTALDLPVDENTPPNGIIDYGIDTVQFSETTPALDGSNPVWQTITQTWQPGADQNSPTTLSTTQQSPSGLFSTSTTYGSSGGNSQSTNLQGNGNWTTTSISPDGTRTESTYVDGKFQTILYLDSNQIPNESQSQGYDSLNRPITTTHSRTGTTTTAYLSDTADIAKSVTDAGNRTTAFTYDIRGRQITVDAPDTLDAQGAPLFNITHTSYYPDSTTKAQWGDQTNPTFHEYDYAQRMVKLHTYQTAPTITHSTDTPPANSAITTWQYSNERGWLEAKRDAANKGTNYTYTDAGRLATRTSARGILTTYGQDKAGRQTSITYSNETNGHTTPDLTMEYDALNRLKKVFRNGVLHAGYHYDPANLTLASEDQQIDTLNKTLTSNRDSRRRPTGYSHSDGSALWDYDNAGRLESITDGTDTFTYGYRYSLVAGKHKGENSGENESYMPFTITGPQVTTTLQYETTRNVLLTRTNSTTAGTVSEFAYTVNNLGQRTALNKAGTAFQAVSSTDWKYNQRGELVQANDSSNANNNRAYEYDFIGNRKKTVNGLLTDLPSSDNYTTNALNQYTSIGNQQSSIVNPAYDLDGNQTTAHVRPLGSSSLESCVYTWDAENRLVKSVTATSTVEYEYDHLSRIIARTESGTTIRYLYDGWNRIAEYQQTGTGHILLRKYLWGMDISGTMQGAGGVGGLLSVSIVNQQSSIDNYFPTYDGNGNVSEYLNEIGEVTAHFEYDPFGNLIVDSENNAWQFPYRFSTKPQDTATGLYYYGYRYYDPVTGRWPSRDPIGEKGGINLYRFVKNNGINFHDILGLRTEDHHWFPQFGKGKNRAGQNMLEDKCPCCEFKIDDYTTTMNDGLHRFVENKLKYNAIARRIWTNSKNCCHYLKHMAALILATHQVSLFLDKYGFEGDGSYPRTTLPSMHPWGKDGPETSGKLAIEMIACCGADIVYGLPLLYEEYFRELMTNVLGPMPIHEIGFPEPVNEPRIPEPVGVPVIELDDQLTESEIELIRKGTIITAASAFVVLTRGLGWYVVAPVFAASQ